MRETVFIRPDRGTSGEFEWLRLGADGPTGAPSRGPLAEAALECEGRRVVFFLPTEDLLLTTASVPARNRQRLLQALPFVLEDRLVQEIETLHFAVGSRLSDGGTAVAVIERARLDGWLATLREAGIEPDMVVPDVLALPHEPGSWTLVNEGPISLVRTSAQGGIAIDTENLSIVLEQALEEAAADRPNRIVVHGDEISSEWEFLSLMGIETSAEPLPGPALDLLARNFREREAIDLLQGDYNRREQLGRLYRPWLPVAATLGAVILVNVVMTGYDFFHLSRESRQLQERVENLYRTAFPDARRVVNPRVQMERGLENLRRGGTDAGGFLDILRATAPLLRQSDTLVVQRLAYRENRLELAVAINDFQSLDSLKQRLSEQTGMDVEIQSASAANGRVEARLQVKARP